MSGRPLSSQLLFPTRPLPPSRYLQAAGQAKIRVDAPGREHITDRIRILGIRRRQAIRPNLSVVRHRRIVEFEMSRMAIGNMAEVPSNAVVHTPGATLHMARGNFSMA